MKTSNGQILVDPLEDTISTEGRLIVVGAKNKLTDLETTSQGGNN